MASHQSHSDVEIICTRIFLGGGTSVTPYSPDCTRGRIGQENGTATRRTGTRLTRHISAVNVV